RHTILSLQHAVGNAVVSGAIGRLAAPSQSAQKAQRIGATSPPGHTTVELPARVQRDGEQLASVSVASVSINAARVSVPPSAGSILKATATPGNATGVKWSGQKGS